MEQLIENYKFLLRYSNELQGALDEAEAKIRMLRHIIKMLKTQSRN